MRLARPTSSRPLLALLALLLLSLASAQEANESGALSPSVTEGVPDVEVRNTPIFATLQDKKNFVVFTSLLQRFDNFSTRLSQSGTRFTAFAPTDNAFVNLARRMYRDDRTIDAGDPAAIIAALDEGLAKLEQLSGLARVRGVLQYHLIGRALSYPQLEAEGTVETQSGDSLTFVDNIIMDVDSKTSGNVTASPRNIFNQNGWIHVVDRVLLPYDLSAALDELAIILSPTPSISASPSTSVSASVTPSQGSSPSPSMSLSPSVTPVAATDDADADADGTSDETLESPSAEVTSPSASTSPGSNSSGNDDDDGVCFPAHATVRLQDDSVVRMDALSAGAMVHHDEVGRSSRVFLFTHRRSEGTHVFRRLTTACGPVVTLTASHYLYVNKHMTKAGAVVVGDELRTKNGDCAVTKVERVVEEGLFAPHSMHGDLVVDDVVVSSYSTAVAPRAAQALLAPVRWMARLTGMREPLGSVFYNGGDWALPLMPRGLDRY